ncbi:sensor histidine kinase [Kribbella sp. NPDC058245]|uniref:sensor histidine kinase n=1 Tax=Kribbella sp. NPDC058245 TaxID=3346399 RepID=UPI0036E732CD
MNTSEIMDRWNAGVTALRRLALPSPRPSPWAWAADAVLALALIIGALDGALGRDSSTESWTPPTLPATPPGVPIPPAPPTGVMTHHYGAAHPWQLLFAILATMPLAARRRYPLAVFWAVIGASELYHLSPGFDPTFTFAACVIAAYSAAMYSPYQVAAIASVFAGVALLVATHKENVPSIGTAPGTFLFLILIPVALVTNTIYTWKQRVRTVELEQEATTRQAVDRERSRIARELHDVVTHNVSVMVVQAGAARKVMRMAPEKAHDALLAVESGGRAAMTELRHTMGLLTMNSDDPNLSAEADLAPPPGLGQVAELAARIRDTGVPVALTVTGRPVPLSVGRDLAAYRVVQEALTNTLKHAVGSRVSIAIDHGPRGVLVEVTDTGGSPAPSARIGNGRGLIGLHERIAIYGGTLETGKLPDGGYRVRAVIPAEES